MQRVSQLICLSLGHSVGQSGMWLVRSQVLRLERLGAMEGVLDVSQMGVLREVVLVCVGALKVHPAVERLQSVKSLKLG